MLYLKINYSVSPPLPASQTLKSLRGAASRDTTIDREGIKASSY